MFSALGKYVRAIGYLLTFRIDKASETLRMNPGVMSANYDRIITEKKARLNQYKSAIASMVAQEETKKQKLKSLTEEVVRLERMQQGAAAKAKKVAASHAGDVEAIKRDPEYLKCQAAYKDFSSTLAEKKERAAEIENDLGQLIDNVNGHKTQIQSLMRDLEKLKEEKHDTVAEVLSAREEQQVADMLTGLSEDRTGEELRELRELRQKAGAEARVSRELAGLDVKRAEEDFLAYAQSDAAEDEFDALIGLGAEADAAAAEPVVAEKTRIPEG